MLRFLITLFFGWIGAHKFMDKKIGLGILYALTCGLFGIGWIIDIIIAAKNINNADILNTCSDYDNEHDSAEYENTIDFSVKGVTFNNDDGESRQTILKELYDNKGYSKRDIELKKYIFNDRDAVAVYAKGKMIGSVPKEYASIIVEHLDTIKITRFKIRQNQKDIYYALIDLILN